MLVFPGETQPGPARDEDPDVGSSTEHIGHERGGIDDVFVIVQDEQQAAFAQECLEAGDEWLTPRFAQAEDLSDGSRDEIGMRNRREADEADAIREILGNSGGDGNGKPGLAHTAWSSQRKQPDFRLTREFNERRYLPLPANDRREREG
jgi:hypothetical protein